MINKTWNDWHIYSSKLRSHNISFKGSVKSIFRFHFVGIRRTLKRRRIDWIVCEMQWDDGRCSYLQRLYCSQRCLLPCSQCKASCARRSMHNMANPSLGCAVDKPNAFVRVCAEPGLLPNWAVYVGDEIESRAKAICGISIWENNAVFNTMMS